MSDNIEQTEKMGTAEQNCEMRIHIPRRLKAIFGDLSFPEMDAELENNGWKKRIVGYQIIYSKNGVTVAMGIERKRKVSIDSMLIDIR